MRFDVFVPETAAKDALTRQLLDLDAAFHTRDGPRVQRLGITRYIIRVLQHWTLDNGGPSRVAALYRELPFGSRIVFESLEFDARKVQITVARMYSLERQLLPLSKLDSALNIPLSNLPPVVDIGRLRLVRQLHDSVSLVMINPSPLDADGDQFSETTGIWVLKALTSQTKYLYHELSVLLRLAPHPHVICQPTFLVSKVCNFGGKTAMVGFMSPYHSGGSLRDSMPLLRMHKELELDQQLRWATQLTSALLHVRYRGRVFYPDLRLDNIVLTSSSDVIVVDFEQRGVWCEFASPEVNALEYVRILASENNHDRDADVDDSDSDQGRPTSHRRDVSPDIPASVRRRYGAMLARYLPGWDELEAGESYRSTGDGLQARRYNNYNVSWLCLSEREQEAAEVYMLGRVLWCLFEGQSAPQPGAVWQSYPREPDLEFPEFRLTPPPLRDLVDQCTRGRRPALSSRIIRRNSRLVLRDASPDRAQSPRRVQQVAQEWWDRELQAAETFLRLRDDMKARDEWTGNYFDRPTLDGVYSVLNDYRESKRPRIGD
jgi:hypothetical protein